MNEGKFGGLLEILEEVGVSFEIEIVEAYS